MLSIATLSDTTPAPLLPAMQPLPPLTNAGTRLLDAASDLFYERGVRAVGVDLIAETAGTTKKTLYDRFGSKDALVALYLLQRAHRWRAFLLERLDDENPGALQVFDVLEAWMGTQRRGCAFVNAHAELGNTDHPALPVIHAEKAWMRALFDHLTGDPARGAHLHLLYEGTLVLHTAGASTTAIDDARHAARTLLTSGDAPGAGR
ncbi:TetR/AcrR family transcriptional regulator [Kineosporia succinea]|uniref:AcrR family transcriptional regulator n=1 Tax=Kineosporia succinea TaxID=84632 RepID=A0ABT9P9E6_9ACTN|nr:TetR/AcrR family transcriptional regulator [Kineosporia succinea]MDP9829308.1 AcrR family transcriptional regulator [Kineosporia succinea]